MAYLLVALCMLFFGCTKTNPPPQESTPLKVEKIQPSKSNCFNHCEVYKSACADLLAGVSKCSDKKESCRDWEEPFFKLFRVNAHGNEVDSKCREACWNVANRQPIEICESAQGMGFEGLTDKAVDLILASKTPHIKAMQVSETLNDMKNKKFSENYGRLLKEAKLSKITGAYVAEELGQGTSEIFMDIFLKGKELNCLSAETKAKLKAMGDKAKVGAHTLDVTSLKKEIVKQCKIDELQVYDKKSLKRHKGELKKISYVRFNPEISDCHYPVPRLEIRFKGKSDDQLLLPKGFTQKPNPKLDELVEEMNNHHEFYNILVHAYSGHLNYQGRTILIAPTPAMTVCYMLMELTPFGPLEVGTVCNEPCGS